MQLLVEPLSCTGGDEAELTSPPEVVLTAEQVIIGVDAPVARGPEACPGPALAPLTVSLGRALGYRELVDLHGTLDDALAPPESRYQDVPAAASAPPTPTPSSSAGPRQEL